MLNYGLAGDVRWLLIMRYKTSQRNGWPYRPAACSAATAAPMMRVACSSSTTSSA
jgi:hypothetical protein